MRAVVILAAIAAAPPVMTSQAKAHTTYIGYSGAPGRQACSISCHHRHNFAPSVTVTGFPTSYVPGQQYTVAVAHQSGSTIKQFNASIRVGTGSTNAGVITAGASTAVYNTSGETNGVHFSTADMNSGDFIWTAPPSGTGTVRLYWAGLQGTLLNGADTQIVLVSTENPTGVSGAPGIPDEFSLSQNYPNPFNSETVIEFSVAEPGQVVFTISDILGRQVYDRTETIDLPGAVTIHWDGRSASGADLPSGVYFYRLHTSRGDLTRKMVLLR